MIKAFTKVSAKVAGWKQQLKEWGRELHIQGDVDMSNQGITELPDFSALYADGNFYCHNNALTSLAGAPRDVKGVFNCTGNKLSSLAGAPKKFKLLISDFGTFTSWNEVPEALRAAPTSVSVPAPQPKPRPGLVL